jgi:hypothetical protein
MAGCVRFSGGALMRRPALVRVLLVVLWVMASSNAQAMPLRLSDLIGSSVEQVEARLAPGRTARPESLVAMAGTGESIVLIGMDDLVGLSGADGHCISAAGGWWPNSAPVLVFKGGFLVDAAAPAPVRDGPMPRDTRAVAFMRSPVRNPVVARAGELPLESDLAGTVARLGRPLPPETVLGPCVGPPRGQEPATPGSDPAGRLQGAMIAPLAVKLSALNADRARARIEGPKALAQLRVGEVLEGGARTFVAEHTGSFVEQHGAAYEILTINLGDEPSRNVARMNEAAFVGLRGGRIEWIAPSSRRAMGKFIALGMCEDANGKPNGERRGCTGYGYFSP